MSPVEMWGMEKYSAIFLPCVPLPEPGEPMSTMGLIKVRCRNYRAWFAPKVRHIRKKIHATTNEAFFVLPVVLVAHFIPG
jgi:hypothetical protein